MKKHKPRIGDYVMAECYKAELAKVKKQLATVEQQYAKAKWWLNEIVNNHRFTPISTAEMAIKDLENTNTDIVFYDKDKKIDRLTYTQRKAEYELQKIKKEMQDD